MKFSRNFLVAAFLFTATPGFAADCVNEKGEEILSQPEVFQALIAKEGSCHEAQLLAESCAWGSLVDLQTAGAAYEVCGLELEKLSPRPELLGLLSTMKTACTDKYIDQDGSLYRSMNAYCHLSALKWVVNLAWPN